MSLGYAEKLSYREDLGGQLGSPEQHEALDVLATKIEKLAELALVGLLEAGKLSYVVSQNVDGLHLRSGLPRSCLAELHGNCFAERCSTCKHEYIRDFEIETVGFKPTGRRCSQEKCRGVLRDHILDWEDALPEDELRESEEQASAADMALCLGTSLQIIPACNIPLRTLKAGGSLVIVNLQKTPKDKKASLVLHARADDVMRQLMQKLGYQIPNYIRKDEVLVSCTLARLKGQKSNSSSCKVTIAVSSIHGGKCPLPMISSAEIHVLNPEDVKAASFRQQPFTFQRVVDVPCLLQISCKLSLTDAADENNRSVVLQEEFQLPGLQTNTAPQDQWTSRQRRSFLTQELDYSKQDAESGGGV